MSIAQPPCATRHGAGMTALPATSPPSSAPQGRRRDQVVEQYFEWARDIADDTAVMDRGAIVLSGTRAEMDETAVRGRMTV